MILDIRPTVYPLYHKRQPVRRNKPPLSRGLFYKACAVPSLF